MGWKYRSSANEALWKSVSLVAGMLPLVLLLLALVLLLLPLFWPLGLQ
jgi:hypothetical protein